jgi:hypothetical protein
MKTRTFAVFVVLSAALHLSAEELKPVRQGPDGRRAFDDLALHYANGRQALPY